MKVLCKFNILFSSGTDGLLSLESFPPFLFDRTDEIVSVMEGSTLWLYCKVNSSSSNVIVKWTMNNKELESKIPHIYVTTNKFYRYQMALLVIDDVVLDDVGIYRCSVTHPEGVLHGKILTFRGMFSEKKPIRT